VNDVRIFSIKCQQTATKYLVTGLRNIFSCLQGSGSCLRVYFSIVDTLQCMTTTASVACHCAVCSGGLWSLFLSYFAVHDCNYWQLECL